MTITEERPDLGRILDTLKDFQRQTVDYVFRRLYEDSDAAKRFLIADEVGLGKTLVAKGVMAKAVDRLWDTNKRIDIVYICANGDIARQNINRLNFTGQKDIASATRITRLPVYLHDLQNRKLNLVSFTPGTSFDLRSSGGIALERAMIYSILREGWGFGNTSAAKNVFQMHVGRETWRRCLDEYDEEIDPGLAHAYVNDLSQVPDVRERFNNLLERYAYSRQHVPDEDRRDCAALVGDLRRVLARTCINALAPNIIILDEFQRFKSLLDEHDENNEMAQLARAVFEYPAAKVMLLSATPYKM